MCGCGLRELEGRAWGSLGGRRESGGGWRLTALKYFLSQKRDLLSDISGIVSHWRDLLSDMSQKRDLLSDMSQKRDLLSDIVSQ